MAALLQSRGIDIDCDDIEACHPLPRRNSGERPASIMRFFSRKRKMALLKQGRKLKGTNVNKHQTRTNAAIGRAARHLKKTEEDSNCKVFIKVNGSPEEAKVLMVRSMEDWTKGNQQLHTKLW